MFNHTTDEWMVFGNGRVLCIYKSTEKVIRLYEKDEEHRRDVSLAKKKNEEEGGGGRRWTRRLEEGRRRKRG